MISTLTFDLLLKKKLNIGHNYLTMGDIPYGKTLCSYQNFLSNDLDLQLWPTSEKN